MEVVVYGGAKALESFSVREIFNQAVDLGVIEDMTVGLYCNRYCNGTFLRPVMRNIVSDVNELYCSLAYNAVLADNGQYGAAEAARTNEGKGVHAQRALTGLVAFVRVLNMTHKVSLNNLVLDFKEVYFDTIHNHIKEAGLTVS
ncbi:hypothetical protein SPFM10_00243 [Salmonella phage SPFM10]|nr:hypothetical protein SPFM10_00243 [Salmonella phage SPFM10]